MIITASISGAEQVVAVVGIDFTLHDFKDTMDSFTDGRRFK